MKIAGIEEGALKKGGRVYKELDLIIEHAKKAEKEEYFIEAYSITWSVIETFLVPEIIKRALTFYKIPLSNKVINRNTQSDFQIFLLLTHEDKIYNSLERHRSIRNNMIHECCSFESLNKETYNDKQVRYSKDLVDLKKNVKVPLIRLFKNKPASIKLLEEQYKKGWDDHHKMVIDVIESS